MPHVTVRGIPKQKLKTLAPEIKATVVKAAETNPDYVKVFYSPVVRVDAEETEIAADIYWMPRPQEMCDRVAEGLTELLKKETGRDFVQITFTEFPGPHFYEDNIHY